MARASKGGKRPSLASNAAASASKAPGRRKAASRTLKLRRLPAAKQKRLDALMRKNNEGRLNQAERDELQALVRQAEELALDNARTLAGQK